MNDRQDAASRGMRRPSARMIISSTMPAMAVRPAIRVIGGIVSIPTLMKL